ncbi:MAG TPA: serine/threonine-protein kinase, partial [Candidatus Hydrogenedentes bacterium]|nr:serine/threonine-protein kinase [Candidatus Hydrogenedentota bacterium]
AASLSHPNIVSIYAVGKHEDVRYIAMEYIKGKTLTTLIREAGRLSVGRALEITLQAADALKAAHRVGMVHRDIKPDNIMIDEFGRVKVMDFGLARGIHSATQLTAEGAVLGTPRYMSPEQCEGLKPDQRSDIYSLGIVLFEMLSGRTPYGADTPLALMRQIVELPLPSLQEISADVPPQVCSIVYRMTAKRPEDRYDNADAVCEDIRVHLEGIRTSSPSGQDHLTDVITPSPQRTPTPVAAPWVSQPLSRRALFGLALAAAIVIVAGGLWWRYAGPQPLHDAPVQTVPTPPPEARSTEPEPPREVAQPPAPVPRDVESRPIATAPVSSQVQQGVESASRVLPPDVPRRLVFSVAEVVLDPVQDFAEVPFEASPPSARLEGVSWYASGPVSAWPRDGAVYIKTSSFDVPFGEESVHKVIARLEDYDLELGVLPVRLRNPVELLQFSFTPASVHIGAGQPSERVSFEVRSAAGQPVSSVNVSFQIVPGDAPVQVVRDSDTTMRVSLDAGARNEAAIDAHLRATIRDVVVAELPVHVAPACVLDKIEFASDGVLLTNADPSAEVYFETTPESLPETVFSELKFQSADARLVLNRISRNVLEVALKPGVRLTGLARESQMLTAWCCGRQVGALRVELLAMAYTPRVFFLGGAVRLSNEVRRADVRFDVDPAGVPPEVLEAISFRADGYELAVTRKAPQEIAVALRDSAVIEGEEPKTRTVTAWYSGGVVGQLAVTLAPFSSLPKVVFLSGALRLTNADRHAEIEFDVAPPDLSAQALDALRFQSNTYEVVVNRKGPRQLEVLLGPLVRLAEGEAKEAVIEARFQGRSVGEIKVLLAGPATVDYVEVYPARVDLTPDKPMAYVSISPQPPEVAREAASRLEFTLSGDGTGITWQRTPSGQLIVSMEAARFAEGEEREATLEIRSHNAIVGRLQVHAARPIAAREVRFTPATLALSGAQTEAQVHFTTTPENIPSDRIEWRADAGLTVRRAGDRMVAVSRLPSTVGGAQELRVYAVIGEEVLGVLPVRVAAPAAATHYETTAFEHVSLTYPNSVSVGSPATIEVQAANWVGADQIGTLVVSIEGCGPEAPLAPDGAYDLWPAGGKVINRFYKDGGVWRRSPEKMVPAHTLVEKYVRMWPRGATQTLRVPVTFNRPGTARLYMRVTFSRQMGTETVVHANFPAAGDTDQQGLPCMTYAVNVLP